MMRCASVDSGPAPSEIGSAPGIGGIAPASGNGSVLISSPEAAGRSAGGW